ncbi:MAG TPA: site-2 protease family protein [Caulobacteraceae bacterium]|nr:site-2 protease family protein [Caulobacteraceae bacterium]
MTQTAAASPDKGSNFVGAAILSLWLALGAVLLLAGHAPHVVTFAFVLVGWILSVMLHEFSHAAVAWLGGDHTVKAKGYLDFDPRRYGALQTTLLIPILALALGGVGFPGGAVYLRNDLMRSRAWRAAAALAGPAATAVILLLLATGLRLWAGQGEVSGDLLAALAMLAFLQAMALILNLLPLPGLDGFNALRPFLPRSLGPTLRRAEGLTWLVLLALIFFVPGVGAGLFRMAAELAAMLGVPPEAMQSGWDAFHFWR